MDYAMHSPTTLKDDIASNKLHGLAMYLVRDRLLDAITAEQAAQAANQQGMSLTNYLVKSKILSSQTILDCCTKYFELPFFDLKNYDTSILNQPTINAELILRYRVIPIHRDENCLSLG